MKQSYFENFKIEFLVTATELEPTTTQIINNTKPFSQTDQYSQVGRFD